MSREGLECSPLFPRSLISVTVGVLTSENAGEGGTIPLPLPPSCSWEIRAPEAAG